MYIRVFCALILGVLCGGAQQAPEVLQLVDQSAVNMAVGHEDAVYCRMENPNRVTVFEGFGRCVLNIDKVNLLHNGEWRMFIGLPGKVVAELFPLNVRVVQREPKPQVQMSAAMSSDASSLTVSCSVETASVPKVCKFRDPWGQILIAQQGASEGRYTFEGSGTSTTGTGRHSMDCGLRISSPTRRDLGIWRCAVETELDTYYGFHLVFWTSLANGTFIHTEPELQARKSVLGATTGDSAEMICTIPARIRYCYFRSSNGTVITVSPGESNTVFDYIGSGFDAGECGIRLRHISSSDAGRWTCHVGIKDYGIWTEQRVHILVYTQEPISAVLFRSRNGDMGVTAIVDTVGLNMEYCRFVRGDGLGFTNEAVPDGYQFSNSSNLRMCQLRILRPTSVDFQSWTVAFGVHGQDYELTANTGVLQRNTSSPSSSSFFVLRMTLIFICLGLFFLSLGLLFSSKDKRRWTYTRATAVRDSVRRTLRFRKPPPVNPPAANANVITSQAA